MSDIKIKNKYYKEMEYLLYNYRMFEISIQNMQSEIDFLKKEDGTTAISYDGVKTSPTFKFSSITENTALSVSEKIDYLEHSIKRIRSKLESIDRAIDGLTDIEKEIIKGRYINGQQWYVVAYKVKYSERHCKRIRTNAIIKIAIALFGDKIIEN